jgi:predicted metalloendopeptidase
MGKSLKKSWGFDLAALDKTVRPQDDLYHFANGGWIKKNKIPADESRWGSFTILRYETEHQLKVIVENVLYKKHPKGSAAQLVADFYRSALDTKRRNLLGARPLASWRKEIAAIETREQLLLVITKLHRFGVAVPWEFYIDQDSKNSDRYLLHLTQDGIGMPEREYYISDKPEYARVRTAYQRYMPALLALAGIPKKQAMEAAARAFAIETKLAKASMRKEDTRDSEKTYNKRTLKALSKEVPSVPWHTYLHALGARNVKEVVVAQPAFFAAVGRMLAELPLADWKAYLEWHLINECAPLLSETFYKKSFGFYGTVLTGSKQMRAPWRRALGATNGGVGWALGRLYVAKHFTKKAKRRMDTLVQDLFAAYEVRIMSLDWMTAATKKKAVAKLRAMKYKIGHPARFETYTGLTIDASDYFGNMVRAQEYQHKKSMRRLNRPVDRKEWFMTPQTINAYCHFNLNEIVFPAAILQPPFFAEDADDAVNYGAIGAVIGHEITHGFDDQGSKFDKKGNMKTWWSAHDKTRFTKKSTRMVAHYNACEVLDGIRANGQLTLGENIADLGGASIAFDAYQNRLKKTGRAIIDGFTPEQRFFLGFAQAEREITRPEFLKMQAFTDPHSVAPLRVNIPASNLDSFYRAFDVKKGDALYRDPKNRAHIW